MTEDLDADRRATDDPAAPSVRGRATASVWERSAAEEPGVDVSRTQPFVAEG